MHQLAIRHDPSRIQSRHESLFMGMFLIAMAGIYLQFHLYSGKRIVFPFPLSNLIGLTYLAVFFNRADGVKAANLVLVFSIFSIPYLTFGLEGGYFSVALSKHLQLITSLVAGYGLYMLILEFPKNKLEVIFRRLALAILIIATLEVYFGFRPIMLAINSILYSWRPGGFYLEETRDLNLWGIVRPLVFSTEPSLVGIWGSTLMIASSVLGRKTGAKRYFVLIGYVGTLVFVTRTTTPLIILTLHFVGVLFEGRKKFLEILGLSMAALISGVVIFFSGFATLLLQYTQNTSFYARITAPYLSAVEAFRISPFFGLGAGNDVTLTKIVFDVWGRNDMLTRSGNYVEAWGVDGMLTNNFFWVWIYFGILGGLVFLAIIFVLLRSSGRKPMIPLVLTIIGVWCTIGGFVDLRTWFFVFLLAACFNSTESEKNGQ